MKPILAVFAAFFAFLPGLAVAQSNPVVIELFTSQGCSSCPPADKLLQRLAKRDDVIALALHVDYWDYIGWKDEFARPSHTLRQKAYAQASGRDMIYTPQMIIGGQDDVVGARAMELADLIAAHKSVPAEATVEARLDGTDLKISIQLVDGPVSGPFDVQLVRFTPMRTVKITRGENAGRSLDYANIVEDWTVLGQWDGSADAEMHAILDGESPAVVLVQRTGQGAILAAARAE